MSVYVTDSEFIKELTISKNNNNPSKKLMSYLFKICDNYKNYYKLIGIESNDLRNDAFIQLVKKWNNFTINKNKLNIIEPLLLKSEIYVYLSNIIKNNKKQTTINREDDNFKPLINHITITNKYLGKEENENDIINNIISLIINNELDKREIDKTRIMEVFGVVSMSPFAFYTQIAKNCFFCVMKKYKIEMNKRNLLSYDERGMLYERSKEEVQHDIVHKNSRKYLKMDNEYNGD